MVVGGGWSGIAAAVAAAKRGWEVVLVPAGALPPVRGHVRKVTCDPSAPGDPAPVRGPMTVWLKPVGWLARLLG